MIIPRELSRYLVSYGLNPDARVRSWTKGLILLWYAVSLIVVLRKPALRSRFRPVLLLAASTFTVLALLENMKWTFYMIYMTPMMVAISASVAGEWARRSPWLLRSFVMLLVTMMVAASVMRTRANPYQRAYQPVVDFLKSKATDDTMVMGGAELAFGYGIRANLIDDIRLGYRSGRQPDFVVSDGRYRGAFEEFRGVDPAIYRHIHEYLDGECVRIPVGDNSVYVRKQWFQRHAAVGPTQ